MSVTHGSENNDLLCVTPAFFALCHIVYIQQFQAWSFVVTRPYIWLGHEPSEIANVGHGNGLLRCGHHANLDAKENIQSCGTFLKGYAERTRYFSHWASNYPR